MNSPTVSVAGLYALCPILIFLLQMVLVKSFRTGSFSQQGICLASISLALAMESLLFWIFITFDVAVEYQTLPGIVYAFITFPLIGYCYFHLFNMSETARRIRILSELYAHQNLTKEEISSRYTFHEMFEIRLGRLVSLKQIKLRNGRYFLDNRGLFFAAKILAFWGGLLGYPSIHPTVNGGMKSANPAD